jgi:hypothetical protein
MMMLVGRMMGCNERRLCAQAVRQRFEVDEIVGRGCCCHWCMEYSSAVMFGLVLGFLQALHAARSAVQVSSFTCAR